jgi:hypothetical protein
MYTELWFDNLNGRDHLEHIGVDGRIILIYMSEKGM